MKKIMTAVFLFLLSQNAFAVQSSNQAADEEKRIRGCNIAERLSDGRMTPGQMTTEESLSYNYLKTKYPEEFKNCGGGRTLAGIASRPAPPALAPYPYQGTVSYVDGATVALTSGQKVNLLGIKILEAKKTEATKFLNTALKDHVVRLVYDREPKDRYGRLQGYLFLGEEFMNRRLIQEGFAEANVVPPNEMYKTRLIHAQDADSEPVPSYDEDYAEQVSQKISRQFYFMLAGMVAAAAAVFWIRKMTKG
jgi:endonuclease YncB( thermonuclease family)